MDFLANDLSVHGQFPDIAAFQRALSQLMVMRNALRQHGRTLYRNQGFSSMTPMPKVSMQQALARLSREARGDVRRWLGRDVPCWDDEDRRQHGGDDYLDCNGDIVTDTAVGEAAFRSLEGTECRLVSLSPSRWEFSPVEVAWRDRGELVDAFARLENYWDAATLIRDLDGIAAPLNSWDELGRAAPIRFGNIRFSDEWFLHLRGTPFAKASCGRLMFLLRMLDQLSGAYDGDGKRTAEGHEIYREHFSGERSSFSDSSSSEKDAFRKKLTFDDPDNPGQSLLCSWHGKESHAKLRLHFSWPIVAHRRVYVVYAGPKITKR